LTTRSNGVVERFSGTLKYEHLYRGPINDGNALAVEVNLFRHTYNQQRPHQALDERTPRAAYLAVEHCD
jgi:transposase InsO family protein